MKSLLVACFICAFYTVNAQKHATPLTQCQLSVEDILRMQSFDIDDPISETSGYVLEELYMELNLIYKMDSNDPSLQALIAEFEETLARAEELELNITMFDDDIANVESLNN